jgi:hypothetical protein
VSACELRFVLEDDLTRASAQLAFAEGLRLAGCLDLLRFPAMRFWVEWNDEIHKRVMMETNTVSEYDSQAAGRRVGVLVSGSVDGKRATLRTFWADSQLNVGHEPILSPVETQIDLGSPLNADATPKSIFHGGYVRLTDPIDHSMNNLMDHVRFRFDDRWSTYYRLAANRPETRKAVINRSLGTVARDAPLLLGFLLLLSAHNATRCTSVCRHDINVKRCAKGVPPLLDHVEVRLSINARLGRESSGARLHRRSPRLHQVRGHLVRRADRVYWRLPHLRGNASLGAVRTRTVCLSFS